MSGDSLAVFVSITDSLAEIVPERGIIAGPNRQYFAAIMGIKKVIETKMPKCLHEKDLKNLDMYVYHSADYTFLENALNPFWTWYASWFPDTMAPNMITLLGFVINIIASFIVLYNDPLLLGQAPRWSYILAGFALITYLNFDSADGKQARRLHASSPLGQLFDHGCDAVNEVFILLVLASACGTGYTYHTCVVMIIQCLAFSLAQILEYHIDILVVGNKFFGTTESIIMLSCVYMLTGVIGIDRVRSKFSDILPFSVPFDMPIIEFVLLLTNIGMILTVLYFMITALVSECPIPENERGDKNLSRGDFLIQLIPS